MNQRAGFFFIFNAQHIHCEGKITASTKKKHPLAEITMSHLIRMRFQTHCRDRHFNQRCN